MVPLVLTHSQMKPWLKLRCLWVFAEKLSFQGCLRNGFRPSTVWRGRGDFDPWSSSFVVPCFFLCGILGKWNWRPFSPYGMGDGFLVDPLTCMGTKGTARLKLKQRTSGLLLVAGICWGWGICWDLVGHEFTIVCMSSHGQESYV